MGDKSNKNRKYGKNKKDPAMKRYEASNRYWKNKVAKIMRHLKLQPDDVAAQEALKAAKRNESVR